MRTKFSLALLLAVGISGCSNAGKDIIVPPAAYDGAVSIHFFRDVDGNGFGDANDVNLSGVRVALLTESGKDTLGIAVSDTNGNARFDKIPFGSYRFAFFRSTINDSLQIYQADTVTVLRVLAILSQLRADRDILLDYPRLTIAQARAYAPGKRVIIRGEVMSPYQAFRDSSAYIRDASGFIRVTGASHVPGRAGNDQGDSVSIVGITGTDLGQPVLQNGVITTYTQNPPPVPRVITVAQARTAMGGTLDAAFVQVSGIVVDTSIVLPDYHVTVGDPLIPANQLEVLFDQLVTLAHTGFKPAAPLVVRGVLRPKGDGTWILMPRVGLDVTFP